MGAMSRGEGGHLGHAGYVMPVRFANRSVLMAACGGLHTVSCHHRAVSLPIFVPKWHHNAVQNKQPHFSITHYVLAL
jgi:hypothetical protein